VIEPIFPILILQVGEIGALVLAVTRPLLYVFSNRLAIDFLFGGEVRPVHKTKFAVEKFIERYAEAVRALNRAIVLSVAFVLIALLASGDAVRIPLIDLNVTRRDWLRVCPAISYGLQIFTLVALSWFLVLRRGLTVLRNELGAVEHFGEIANLMLTGVLGSLWLVISVQKHFPSKWHLLWFGPVGLLLFLVLFSPAILCGYFVIQLYALGDLVPAIVYSVFLVPSVELAFVLIGVSVLGSIHEVLPDPQGGRR
jgi:hypothetical protein